MLNETLSVKSRFAASRALRWIGLSLALLVVPACSSEEAPRWNVLLVTLDTTRSDHLSCYDDARASTPAFDQLAELGTKFDNACSTSAATPISHASILTGLWNHEHGVRVISAESGFRLSDRHPTLFTELRAAGWDTAAIHSSFTVSSYFGLTRGCTHVDDITTEFERSGENDSWDVREFQRRSDETTDLALDYVRKAEDPWALWVHYWDPHDRGLVPPDEHLQGVPRDPSGYPQRTPELYAAEVSYMDSQFGRLLDELRSSGELERTLIVVVGDHGEGLGDHGWYGHRLLYQEQLRIPLIVYAPSMSNPDGKAPQREVTDFVRTIDVYPTVLDYLGLEPSEAVTGESLRALIDGEASGSRVVIADQLNGYDRNANLIAQRPLDDFLYCVVKDGWKLIYRPSHPEESLLYDLGADPQELNSLYVERSDMAVMLKRELARHAAWVTEPFPPDAQAGEGAAEALSALGYVAGEIEGGGDWQWACPDDDAQRFAEADEADCSGSRPVLARER